MGIQGFTKVFSPRGEIKIKPEDLKDKHISIDVSAELHRAALGMSARASLTDKNGNPTSHINTILLGVILKLRSAGALQYWVFDYDQKRKTGETFHVQMKELELMKRKVRRQKADTKLRELKERKKELEAKAKLLDDQKSDVELFSSDEEDHSKDLESSEEPKTQKPNKKPCIEKELQNCDSEIDKHEKRAFRMKSFYMDDVILMLNMLDIPWLMCPPGFEAEQVCAMATKSDKIFGVKMDYVLTPDADAITFGAVAVIKRDIRNKKFFEYRTQEILDEYGLSQDDIIKISLVLGCDYAKKTPRIGVKTVLAKFRCVELTPEQEKAACIFRHTMSEDELKTIEVMNFGRESFTDREKYDELLDWLQLTKNYDRERIDTQFKKIGLFLNMEETIALKTTKGRVTKAKVTKAKVTKAKATKVKPIKAEE